MIDIDLHESLLFDCKHIIKDFSSIKSSSCNLHGSICFQISIGNNNNSSGCNPNSNLIFAKADDPVLARGIYNLDPLSSAIKYLWTSGADILLIPWRWIYDLEVETEIRNALSFGRNGISNSILLIILLINIFNERIYNCLLVNSFPIYSSIGEP